MATRTIQSGMRMRSSVWLRRHGPRLEASRVHQAVRWLRAKFARLGRSGRSDTWGLCENPGRIAKVRPGFGRHSHSITAQSLHLA